LFLRALLSCGGEAPSYYLLLPLGQVGSIALVKTNGKSGSELTTAERAAGASRYQRLDSYQPVIIIIIVIIFITVDLPTALFVRRYLSLSAVLLTYAWAYKVSGPAPM